MPPRRPSGRCRRCKEGDVTESLDVTPTQHFTEPPPRYTEASLVKALEEHGIGRPSTYAATISTIVDRGYVVVKERRLHPEPVADIVTDLLVDHFGEYVDLAFTARMEEELDEIARGERAWVPLLRDVLRPVARPASTRSARSSSAATSPPRRPTRSAPRATRWSSGSAATAGSSPARSIRSTRSRARCPVRRRPKLAGEGETCPKCGEGHAGHEARPVRGVPGLLALPRLRLHPARGPAAARPAAVRGHLPQERRRPPRGASRAAHRERLLGVLELPEVRLHDQPPADGRDPRRDEARRQGRGGAAWRGRACA